MADTNLDQTIGDIDQRFQQLAVSLDALRKKIAEYESSQPEAGSPMGKKLEQLRAEAAQVEAQQRQLTLPSIPPPPPRAITRIEMQRPGSVDEADWEKALGTLRAERTQKEQDRILGQARAAASREEGKLGMPPPPRAALSELMGHLGALNPVIEATQKIFGMVNQAGNFLSRELSYLRVSISDVIAEQQRQLQDLRSGRQTGVGGADELRRALTAQELQEFTAAQSTGNVQGQREVLQRAQTRLQAQAAQTTPGAAQNTAQLLQELNELEQRFTAPGGRLLSGEWAPQWALDAANLTNVAGIGGGRAGIEEQRRQLLRRAQLPEDFIGNIGTGPLTPEQRRQIAQLAGGPSIQAQAGSQTIGNILQSGILPNLRPGAPDIRDLPNLFRSRQTDVLDIHSQVQQEAVRDLREEQRFNAQMRLWEQILQTLQLGGAGNGTFGGQGGGILGSAPAIPFAVG